MLFQKKKESPQADAAQLPGNSSKFFSIKNKVFASIFIPCILVIALIFVLLNIYIIQIMNRRILQSAGSVIDERVYSLQNFIGKYDTLTLSFSLGDTFHDLLEQDMSAYNILHRSRDLSDFNHQLLLSIPTQLETSGFNASVRVYFPNYFPFFSNGNQYLNYSDAEGSAWFSRIMAAYKKDRTSFFVLSPEEIYNSPSKADAFSFAKVVVDLTYYKDSYGIIRIDIPSSYLGTIFSDLEYSELSNFILNDAGQQIYSSEKNYTSIIDDAALKELCQPSGSSLVHPDKHSDSNWFSLSTPKGDCLARVTPLANYGLQLVSLVPKDDILAELYSMLTGLILCSVVLFLLSLLLATILAKSMTQRIYALDQSMTRVQSGELIPIAPLPHRYTDEIDSLVSTYNYMVEQMVRLMDTTYQNGIAIKDAELRVLQAQINPHFLYNTLDMIHWFAEEGMVKEIDSAVNALAQFYRLSLSKGKEIITLKEELRHVEAYMTLQNLRFRDSITYRCTISEQFDSLPVVKTILQPIVENAIFHGLAERPGRAGSITISGGILKKNVFQISVTDDGVGMTPENLQKLNEGSLESNDQHGFGVKNVDSRLKLHYGAEYGLHFCSELGKGTTADVTFPIADR